MNYIRVLVKVFWLYCREYLSYLLHAWLYSCCYKQIFVLLLLDNKIFPFEGDVPTLSTH